MNKTNTNTPASTLVVATLAALVAVLATVVIMRFQLVESNVVHNKYYEYGRYINGTVITNDGNEFGYDTDTISDEKAYDNEPVVAVFDDNGTPNDITDDIVLGLVKDVNTAIYDELENKLSDKFELTRDGNKITITSPTQ